MSQSDFDQDYKDMIYEEIYDLHRMDGVAWTDLSTFAGYKGGSSLKNIIQQQAHSLEFSRGLHMMHELANQGNKRLHKYSFDTKAEMMVNRPKIERATGDLTRESMEAVQTISEAMRASQIRDHKTMTKAYYNLLNYVCRLREEIEVSQSVLAKQEELC